jgi:hypothetical protein
LSAKSADMSARFRSEDSDSAMARSVKKRRRTHLLRFQTLSRGWGDAFL